MSSPTTAWSASGREGPSRWRPPRALILHTDLPAGEIAREAVRVASEICVFTNDNIVSEEIASP